MLKFAQLARVEVQLTRFVRQNIAVTDSELRGANFENVLLAAQIVASAKRITVLTGAGISTDSGIPDFRGPNGLWKKSPDAERAATLQHYLRDTELRERSWQNRARWINNNPQPNSGHRALVALEQRGALVAVITQNVDELHQRAGHDPSKVIEVHGSLHRSCCWECQDRRSMNEAIARVLAGDPDPKCELCGGILKSDTILFGQSLDQDKLESAMQASGECDVFISVGSSLSVYPANSTVPNAKRAGAKVIIVNGEQTEMDDYADVIVNQQISLALPQICGVVNS